MNTALFTTHIQTASYNTIAQNLQAKNSFVNSTLVVIDTNVEDYQLLASHVVDGAIVLVLDVDRDGIEQITEAIQTCSQLESLHIVSHGSPGCLYLGNTQLSLETIDRYTHALQSWFERSAHCSISPSLLLYGCHVAANDAGKKLVEILQSITGVSVAASSALTGNAAQGGNWELDFQTDPFEINIPFTRQALDNYRGTLAINFDPASALWTNLKRTNDPNKGSTDASWTANASDFVGDSTNPYIQIQTDGTNIAFKVLAEPQSGDFKALMGIFVDVDGDGSPDFTVQLNIGNVTNNYQVAEYTFIPIETGIAADANTRPNNTVIPAANSGTYFNLKSGGTANNPANVQIYGPAARTGVKGVVARDVDADNSKENYYVFSFTLAQLDTFRTAVTNTHNGGTPGSVYKEIPQWPATQTNVYAVGLTASNSLNAVNGDIGGGAYALIDTWKDIFGFEPPDTTAPTIAVTSNDSTLTIGETATITFTLSEASTNFSLADITFSGGTLSNFTGSGTTYTATFTPADNSTTNGVISVASNQFSDAAGNQNADGADADNTLTLTVNTTVPTNTLPVAVDDSFSMAEDGTAITLNLIGNDTDTDGDTLSVKSINGTTLTPGTAQSIAVTNGTVNVSATGAITFTPAANYNGSISFDYIVQDGNGGEDTGTVNGTVIAGNTPPVAVNDSFTVAENGTAVSVDLITNDTDTDGDTLSIKSINGTALTPGTAQSIAVTNGTVNVSATGAITFTPDANYNGSISFDYIVQDGNGGEDTGTVNGTVTATNDAPVAVDDSFSMAEDGTAITLNLIGNDTDTDGDTLSVKSINGTTLTPGTAQSIAVTNGTVNVSATGAITFTPAANYNGAISFDYIVQDGNGGEDTGTVNGTVTPASNNSPVAVDDSFTVAENGTATLDLIGNDTDSDGDILSIKSINGTALTPGTAQTIAVTNGTVNVNAAGAITFTPAANYNGAISFDYIVQDGNGGEDTGTVNGTVTPASNNSPVAVDDSFTVAEDGTAVSVDLIGNDTDTDGDTLSVKSINGTTLTPGTAQSIAVTNGTVNVSATGAITFTPAANYNGSISFDYIVQDGNGGEDTGTVNGTVTATNDAPVAVDDSFSMAEDGTAITLNLIGNDTDIDGDTLSVKSINGTTLTPGTAQSIAVTNGTVNVNAAGAITFTPAANYNGAISFDYIVQDGKGGEDTGTVNGTITAQQDTDNDGVFDANDLDDDNDGILDTVEQNGNPNRDTDGDGILDALDLDADNDGITDLKESGLSPAEIASLDANGDGAIDHTQPFGANGLADAVETTPESGTPDYNNDGSADSPVDTDGDGVKDFQDLDADNDGINDVLEAGGTDLDGNGLIDGATIDSNGNGLADAVDPNTAGTPLPLPDTDNDGAADFRDLDSDNDGIKDLTELGGNLPDANSDGKVDGADSDGDGLIDVVDGNNSGFGSGPAGMPQPQDLNNNGIADFLEPPRRGGGSQGADDETGSSGGDILNGFSDLDILRGGDGNDTINGGSDQDILRGDVGDDILNGGSNNDDMDGGVGNDILNGGTGDDTMLGYDGDDILNGGPGKDLLEGGLGNDLITGNEDKDRLFGDEGNDKIRGDRGNDIIVGGFGKDTLTGGQGRDRFVYHSVEDFGDVITDFEIVKDRFDFKDFFKDPGSMSDIQLKQRGDDVLLKVNVGNGFKTLGIIQDVETETLKARHFIF